MKRTLGITLLLLGSALGDSKSAAELWNQAVVELHQLGMTQEAFRDAAKDWAVAREAEIETPGSVSIDALRKFTAMWKAWQAVVAQERRTEKAMHEFAVAEENR